MFVPARSPATNASVPARDFSTWLQRTVSPDDEVHLVLDAAGAPALLPRPRTPPPPFPSSLRTVPSPARSYALMCPRPVHELRAHSVQLST